MGTMSTGGTRQRRKGHGGSAVCMAIVASQKQQLTAAILFSESSVTTFDIKFEEEDAELGPKCDADFETLLGAHTAATAMMMKDESSSEEDEPERSRRGSHGSACVQIFSNRLCKEFTMSTGGTRQRRKGHGGSAVCMAIVASQKQQLTAAILFSESSVTTFDIKFAEEDAELGAKCDADFETLLGAHT